MHALHWSDRMHWFDRMHWSDIMLYFKKKLPYDFLHHRWLECRGNWNFVQVCCCVPLLYALHQLRQYSLSVCWKWIWHETFFCVICMCGLCIGVSSHVNVHMLSATFISYLRGKKCLWYLAEMREREEGKEWWKKEDKRRKKLEI